MTEQHDRELRKALDSEPTPQGMPVLTQLIIFLVFIVAIPSLMWLDDQWQFIPHWKAPDIKGLFFGCLMFSGIIYGICRILGFIFRVADKSIRVVDKWSRDK